MLLVQLNGMLLAISKVLMQWGKATSTANTVAVKLPTSYTVTTYVVNATQIKSGGSTSNLAITERTKTQFTLYAEQVERANGVLWASIGY